VVVDFQKIQEFGIIICLYNVKTEHKKNKPYNQDFIPCILVQHTTTELALITPHCYLTENCINRVDKRNDSW
jgi:hypothetical protein